MRPALAVVGPVLGDIRTEFHLSGAMAALLTALPVGCFALLGPLAPSVSRRFGLERALAVALVVLLAGSLLRLGPNLATLLGGTVALGCGIALTNVLLPALVKRDFPQKAGPITGTYSTMINLSAAAAAGSVVPIAAAAGHGWRAGLAVWILPVFPALAVSAAVARRARPSIATGEVRLRLRGLARSKRARQIVAFTTAQSIIYYGVLSWLPSIYISHGLSPTAGGLLLSLTTLLSAPVALVLPTMAARRADQRRYVVVIASCAAAGLTGILAAPTAGAYLWMVLLAIGLGGAFPLALTLFVLRARDAAETAQLSAGAQTVAYLVAAGGPIALGSLHDLTGSWAPGIGVLIICAAAELWTGLGAARPGHISDALYLPDTPAQPLPC